MGAKTLNEKENLIGKKFNYLKVVALTKKRRYGYRVWECSCVCGTHCEVRTALLKDGRVKSCGCKIQNRYNGESKTKIYYNWIMLLGSKRKIPEAWKEFRKFKEDVGTVPNGHSLKQKDRKLPFSKDNFVWVPKNQNEYRGSLITFQGETHNVAVWAKRFGLSRQTLTLRLNNGWPLQEAFTSKKFDAGRKFLKILQK